MEVQNKPAGQEAFLPFRRPLLTLQDQLDRHSSACAAGRKRPHSLTSRIGFAHNSSSSFPMKQTRNRQQQKIKNKSATQQSQQYGQAYAAWPGLRASYVFFFLHAAAWPGLRPVPHEVTGQHGQAYAHPTRVVCFLFVCMQQYGQAYAPSPMR